MASVFIKFKIMPEEADTDMEKLMADCEEKLQTIESKIVEKKIEPVAFGLKALFITVVAPEVAGGTEPFEKASFSFTNCGIF